MLQRPPLYGHMFRFASSYKQSQKGKDVMSAQKQLQAQAKIADQLAKAVIKAANKEHRL